MILWTHARHGIVLQEVNGDAARAGPWSDMVLAKYLSLDGRLWLHCPANGRWFYEDESAYNGWRRISIEGNFPPREALRYQTRAPETFQLNSGNKTPREESPESREEPGDVSAAASGSGYNRVGEWEASENQPSGSGSGLVRFEELVDV